MTNYKMKLCDEHKLMQQAEKVIYHWMFHYNYLNGTWNGVPRDEIVSYFNGSSPNSVSDADFGKCVEKAVQQEIKRRENV